MKKVTYKEFIKNHTVLEHRKQYPSRYIKKKFSCSHCKIFFIGMIQEANGISIFCKLAPNPTVPQPTETKDEKI